MYRTLLLAATCVVAGCQRADVPNQPPQSTVRSEAKGSVAIDTSTLESKEWEEAIATARSHMSKFGGFYSLMRIVLEDAQPNEKIKAQAAKTKKLTPQYHGGGSAFEQKRSGDFLFIEHINSNRRKDGRDPLVVESPTRGTETVWIDVPTRDELGIVGDIRIKKTPLQ